MRNSPLLALLTPTARSDAINDPSADAPCSGSFVLSGPPNHLSPVFQSVDTVLSSLQRADLLLLSVPNNHKSKVVIPSLPVSPYPVHPGTAIRAHFVVDKEPDEPGWRPWISGTWSKWVKGTVVGYKDFAGREAKVSLRLVWTGHTGLTILHF